MNAKMNLDGTIEQLPQIRSEDFCEVCGVWLEPAPLRCEKHAHTEPGDPEWTYKNKE